MYTMFHNISTNGCISHSLLWPIMWSLAGASLKDQCLRTRGGQRKSCSIALDHQVWSLVHRIELLYFEDRTTSLLHTYNITSVIRCTQHLIWLPCISFVNVVPPDPLNRMETLFQGLWDRQLTWRPSNQPVLCML